MTRDGTFLIENGEITHPIKNLRFTQSYLDALRNVDLVGREVRLQAAEDGGGGYVVPALKLHGWNFTGATEF
jgi:predicted Zn-dependent protease